MKEPLVSVIMPVYNGKKYICQAVESVFLQDVPLELLVIDDCSADGTRDVLAVYEKRENFRYFRNQTNQGAAASRNFGVRKARGKYIAYLDADDWWAEGKLKAQLEVLEKKGGVLCSTGRELMNEDGSPTGKYIPVKDTVAYRDLLTHNSINCSSVLVAREAATAFPMEHDDSHEDYLTWLKILKHYGPARGINEPYLKYRLTSGGKSRNKRKSAAMTYRVYRYMGYHPLKCLLFFISYAFHGVWKYR